MADVKGTAKVDSNETTLGDAPELNGTGAVASNGALVPLVDKDKVKAIHTALGGMRVFFENKPEVVVDGKTIPAVSAWDQVNAVYADASGKTEEFYGLPILMTEKGIQEAARICVATLGTRDKDTKVNGLKAVTIFPIPGIEDFLSTPEAAEFVKKLVEREAADVIFGNLRSAESIVQLQTAFNGIPVTVAEIITTSRESSGIDTDAFDVMWTPFRTGVLKVKQPTLEKMLPQKPEVIKAIRSASYALANPKLRAIEEKGLFVKIAAAMVAMGPSMQDKTGKSTPVDTSIIQDWIDDRANQHISFKEDVAPTADDLASIEF